MYRGGVLIGAAAVWLWGIALAGAIQMGFYYVSGRDGEHGMWRALRNLDGTWSRGDQVLLDGAFDCDAVDPDAVRLADGRVRLFYFRGYFCTPPPTGTLNRIHCGTSAYAPRGRALLPRQFLEADDPAFEYEGITDPTVVQTARGDWLMACAKASMSGTDIVLARSTDGLHFAYERTLSPGGIPELTRLDDGSLRLYYNGLGGIVSRGSSDHGVTWSNEPGLRLSSTDFIADPSVVRVNATSWYMWVKGFTNGIDTGPASHKVMVARGTNAASFAFIDTNALVQASVPDGLMARLSITGAPMIHVHIVVHTEQITPYHLPSVFENQRTNLYKFARMLHEEGAKMNFQSDWNFLAAVTNFDRFGRPETGGTNIVLWMKRDLGHEIDPHNHVGESSYNYADVAALMNRCGVPATPIVGGFRASPLHESEWGLFQTPITGNVFTAFVWRAGILWGAATPAHVNETSLWYSGIYRPKNAAEFWTHRDGNMPMIGGMAGGDTSRGNLDRLLALRDAGRLCADQLYTAHISVRGGDINDTYIAELRDFIRSYAGVPNLQWTGLMETYRTWMDEYDQQPGYLPYDANSDLDGDQMHDGWEIEHFCSITFNNGTDDVDGDDYTIRQEFIADTIPTHALSFPPSLSLNGGGALLLAPTSSNRLYRIEQTTNLRSGAWTLWTNRPGGGPIVLSMTNAASVSNRFFRYSVGLP